MNEVKDLDGVLKAILVDPTAYNAAQSACRDELRRSAAPCLVVEGETQRNDICRAIFDRVAKIKSPARWIGLDTSEDEAEDAINRAICKWSQKTPIDKHKNSAGIMSYLRTMARNDLYKRSNEPTRQEEFERKAKDYRLDNIPTEDVSYEDVERCPTVKLLSKLLGDAKLEILYLRWVGVSSNSIAYHTNANSEPVKLGARRIDSAIRYIGKLMGEHFGSGYRENARKDEAIRSLWQIKRKEIERQIAERGIKIDFKDGFYLAPSDLLSSESPNGFLAIPQERYEKFLGVVSLDGEPSCPN